jgi:putative pre-16S rRNA nuclease
VRVLGVDFGLRKIGLALSDEEARLASPLRALAVASVAEAPGAVAAAAREVEAGAIVVGAPLGLEGEEGRIELRRVRRFAQALRRATGLAVHLVDESLSSREAEERAGARSGPAQETGRSGRARNGAKDALHAAAAAVILQRWIDEGPRRDSSRASRGSGQR